MAGLDYNTPKVPKRPIQKGLGGRTGKTEDQRGGHGAKIKEQTKGGWTPKTFSNHPPNWVQETEDPALGRKRSRKRKKQS